MRNIVLLVGTDVMQFIACEEVGVKGVEVLGHES